MDYLELRQDIIAFGRIMLEKGLVVSTWGNISSKIPGSNLVAVTPSGRNYLTLEPADIVIVDLEGNVVDGGLKPTSELQMHLKIYLARQDILAIAHTHSVFASACAVAGKAIPPIIEDLVQVVGGSVEVAKYALPGTIDLATNVVKSLKDKRAVLLANHGVVGCGKNLSEAVLACELVEKSAQILLYASQLGNVNILSEQDINIMHQFYLNHYCKQQEA